MMTYRVTEVSSWFPKPFFFKKKSACVLQMAGSLQFVRRWVVFGRVLHQSCSEICGVALLFVLLLLLWSHTGSLVLYSLILGLLHSI